MKCMVNGKVIEMTEEMIEEMNNETLQPIITDKDRISALENAFADLAVMLMGGISNG